MYDGMLSEVSLNDSLARLTEGPCDSSHVPTVGFSMDGSQPATDCL